MKKLVYSPQYRRKLKELKQYLDLQYGTAVRKRILKMMTDRLHMLQQYENSGVSLQAVYGITNEYRYVFVAHHYIFYHITDGQIQIVSLYHEREDFIADLLGSKSTDEEEPGNGWNHRNRSSDGE